MSDEKKLSYGELRELLQAFTPEQLAAPVVWSGDERGGCVKDLWVAEEDWIGDSSDPESWMPRSEAMKHYADDYRDAEVCLAKGTPHLMVD
jgi:hypothetical protein